MKPYKPCPRCGDSDVGVYHLPSGTWELFHYCNDGDNVTTIIRADTEEELIELWNKRAEVNK